MKKDKTLIGLEAGGEPFLEITKGGLKVNVPEGFQDRLLRNPASHEALQKIYLLRDFVQDARQKPEYAHISTQALELYRDWHGSRLMAIFDCADLGIEDTGEIVCRADPAEEELKDRTHEIFQTMLRYRYGSLDTAISEKVFKHFVWLVDHDKTFGPNEYLPEMAD
jgi:hypothetical protein